MPIEITDTKNGEKTCIANGIRLHSAYAPVKEAERFVQSLACSFEPTFVLVTEPALSYCAEPLGKRFPKAKLCAIRYTDSFSEWNGKWAKVFTYSKQGFLSEEIYAYMGEEGISSCLFASWQPSEKAFPDQNRAVWNEIKQAVVKSRNVLSTMTYFARRWTKNALRFCLFSHYNGYFQRGSCPIIVCASGKSLEGSLSFLRSFRQRFFLIALSSSLLPLYANKIKPDLILSTDGGYWAKRHLSFALKHFPGVPLALPAEASLYTQFFLHPVVPLSYGDGCSESLLEDCGYTKTKALRNGTVSGTAAYLAMDLTSGPVFFCGLDLAPSKGFSHTQPNALESDAEPEDFRLRPMETRVLPSSFRSTALDTYRTWFSAADFKGRVFRLSNSFHFSSSLGSVSDVDWDFFKQSDSGGSKPNFVIKRQEFSIEERRSFLVKKINEHLYSDEWIKNALPSEYVVYQRSIGTENEEEAKEKIQTGMTEFSKDIIRSLGRS